MTDSKNSIISQYFALGLTNTNDTSTRNVGQWQTWRSPCWT